MKWNDMIICNNIISVDRANCHGGIICLYRLCLFNCKWQIWNTPMTIINNKLTRYTICIYLFSTSWHLVIDQIQCKYQPLKSRKKKPKCQNGRWWAERYLLTIVINLSFSSTCFEASGLHKGWLAGECIQLVTIYHKHT